jgi:muramoyltetrapeptide carboxypeptidase LdcA involved in peptidoglycan recycling
VKARRLEPGDTIGVVAPSGWGPSAYPHRVERGVRFLEGLGYRVVLGEHLGGRRGDTSGTPEERVADLHRFLADPGVRAIVSAIGGDHACHLLPLLDFDLVRADPKILLGSSDFTVLNVAIHATTGLVTFNGPALMTDLAEYPAPLPYTVDHLLRALTQPAPIGELRPADAWTEEFLDWGVQADLQRPRALRPSPGWAWLKDGRAAGPLVGGCLESLQHLRGTPYWPDLDGAILFLETSELAPSPGWVDPVLQDYENMGVFARLAGLLVGRPYGYDDARKAELHRVLLERTRRHAFPIVAEMDFGHTAPQLTLPIGCRAEIDTTSRRFAGVEAAVTGKDDIAPVERGNDAPED